MGKEIGGILPSDIRESGKADERTGEAAGAGEAGGNAGAGGKNTGNPPAENPRTRKPQSGGSAAEGRSGAAKAPEAAELAPVAPAPAPEKPKPKAKKKPSKAKTDNSPFTAEQISALFLSGSAILAARPGFEMFALSAAESDQLAKPLSNMAAKCEALTGAGEYVDAISLVTATLMIFIPRILLYFDTKKMRRIEKNGGVQIVRQEKAGDGNPRPTPTSGTPNATGTRADISAAIPSLA